MIRTCYVIDDESRSAPVGMVGCREMDIVDIDDNVYFSASAATVKLWYKIPSTGSGWGTVLPYYSSDFDVQKTFTPDDNS